MDVWLTETYFDWLRSECFSDIRDRNTYDGCLRLLHDIPFYWTVWLDEDRAGDALAYRQNDFLGYQQDLDTLDQVWLQQWATATPTVLEVLLGCARRWNSYFEAPVPFYFQHLFTNLRMNRYPGRHLSSSTKNEIRLRIDTWMSHQFEPNGEGSPFPVIQHIQQLDMRGLDMWTQMNAYSAQHFQ